VTFLAQRVESLMGFFYVATLYAAIRSAESDFRANRWTAAAIAACALGMATKETMIGAPVMVALWLWTCRPGISLLKAPRTLLLGLAGTMIIAIALGVSGARSGSAGFGVEGWPWWSYLRTQAGVIVHYLRLAFWPHPLVFAYDWLPAPSWMAVLPQIVLLEVLGVATLVALFRRWPIGLLGAWFFLILAPSSSIVPIATEVAAEHRMYLPLAAVIAAIVLTVEAGFRFSGRAIEAGFRFSRSGDEGPPVLAVEKRNPASTLLVVLAIPLAVATYDRNRVYASAEGIAAATVRDRPENALAQLTYGTYLAGQNRFAEAEPHLRAALSLPLSPFTDESKSRSLGHFYLGLALRGQGRNDDAARELALALAAREDFDRAYPLLAEAQLDQKRPAAAVATLERALARRPDDPALLKRVAWVLATSSDSAVRNAAGAVRYAEHGVAVTDSRDPVALDVLAAALAEVGQFDQAMAALAKAAELVRTGGPAELIPTLREHLALLEARRPIRSPDW
jgi:tetratricopeptide (TPR) repeat protein